MSDADRERLEERIADDPEDVDLWKVYADHLQGAGDPRGELIVLQIAAAAEREQKFKNKGPAEHAARKYLAKHTGVFLGPLVALKQVIAWRSGFIYRVVIDNKQGRPAELLDTVLSHPSGKFVTEIALRGSSTGLAGVIARHPLRALRDLELYTPDPIDLPWPHLDRLRRLSVTGRALHLLTGLAAPRARHASFSALVVDPYAMRAIAQAPWPALERLEIRLGTQAPFAPFEEIDPLLRRTDLPALTHLKIRQAPAAGAILRALASHPLGAQLQVIDLAHGQLTPQDVRFVAERKQVFRALRELWLPASALSGDGKKLLAGTAKHVVPDSRAPLDTLERDLAIL